MKKLLFVVAIAIAMCFMLKVMEPDFVEFRTHDGKDAIVWLKGQDCGRVSVYEIDPVTGFSAMHKGKSMSCAAAEELALRKNK